MKQAVDQKMKGPTYPRYIEADKCMSLYACIVLLEQDKIYVLPRMLTLPRRCLLQTHPPFLL